MAILQSGNDSGSREKRDRFATNLLEDAVRRIVGGARVAVWTATTSGAERAGAVSEV
jgi:hypothetical protein